MSFPLIVTYYTAGTPYEEVVQYLLDSCSRLNLRIHAEALPSSGDWVLNCGKKGPFVQQCMERFDCPLLWVDADAEIKRYPAIFENAPFEFAAHFPR